MVEQIYTWLINIGSFFVSVANLLWDLVDGVLYVIDVIAGAIVQLPFYFAWLPASVVVGLLALIGLVVALRFLEVL